MGGLTSSLTPGGWDVDDTPSAAQVGGGTAARAPSTNNYRLRCIVGRQTGVVVDSGGRGFNGYAANGNDQLWSNRGYISSKAAAVNTDGSVMFSPRMLDWEYSGAGAQSLILSMRFKAAAPASAMRIMGNSAKTDVRGFAIAAMPTGHLGVRVSDGTATVTAPDSGRVACDGSEHFVFVTVDGASKVLSIWIDDEEIPSAVVGPLAGSTLNSTSPFRIGSAGVFSENPTHPVQVADLQIITVPGGLPANISTLRRMLRVNPAAEITTDLLPDRIVPATEGAVPITAGATAATKSLYRYLKRHQGRDEFLIGAHDRFDDPQRAPNAHGYLDIYQRISGQRPAIMQWEYVDINQPNDGAGSTGAQRQPNLLAAMRAHAAAGGINMLHDHSGHPLTASLARSMEPNSATGGNAAGSSWDTTPGALAAINTGGAQEAQFLAYLDRLASFIQQVEYPVILRPFHEANGDWFWWGGASNAATFRAVWIKMVTYLRDTKGITNALYCWNINGADDSASITANNVQAYSQWYPGDAYVDIVSMDYYNNAAYSPTASVLWTLGRRVLREGVDALNAIAAPGGKPVILAELGYQSASASKPDLWELVGADMSSIYRDCAALALWRAPWGPDESHASAPSLARMMQADYCITLEKSGGKAYTS